MDQHFRLSLRTNPNMSILIISLLLLLIVVFLTRLKRTRFPPGPRGFPIVGNIGRLAELNHHGLAALAKIHGGLCYLKVGQVHIVVVSNAAMAQQVLQVQDHIFANRHATTATAYLSYDRADMAFANYGPFWRQMRKICVTKVFSRKRAESWSSVRDEICSLLKAIGSNINEPVNIGEAALGLTKNITYRAAFGSTLQEGQGEFLKIMQEFSELFGEFNVGDFIPCLSWIDGRDFRMRLENARGSLDGFIDKIIDDHANKRNLNRNEVEEDMVDELMEFYDQNADHQKSTITITRDNIKALIMDVMFGGTETVASAVEWAMAELMHTPDDLKRVQQELAQVVGFERTVNEFDIEKLTYLKCVIKETLRLHPPIPVLQHETTKSTVVDGYTIPARARVMINAWAIGRDETAWVDPNSFKPGRFLEEDAPNFRGGDFQFIPFGSGRRSCPGMKLGLYALELAVANLCHSFDWELPDGMKPSDLEMSDVFRVTAPRAVQLVAIPKRRLDVRLY